MLLGLQEAEPDWQESGDERLYFAAEALAHRRKLLPEVAACDG
jgi:hypothetical protein